METLGTVLIVARGGPQWTATADVLSDEYDYRVLTARSADEAANACPMPMSISSWPNTAPAGDGLEFLTNLRISHPEVIRVLALEAKTELTKQAISPRGDLSIRSQAAGRQANRPGGRAWTGVARAGPAPPHAVARIQVPGDSMHIHARHGMPLHAESQRFEKLVYVSEKLTRTV